MVWPLPRPWSETMVSIPLVPIPLSAQKTLEIKGFRGLERPLLDLVSQTPRTRGRGRPLFADFFFCFLNSGHFPGKRGKIGAFANLGVLMNSPCSPDKKTSEFRKTPFLHEPTRELAFWFSLYFSHETRKIVRNRLRVALKISHRRWGKTTQRKFARTNAAANSQCY